MPLCRVFAAKCAFSEADMRRAHALVKPERADRRDARVSERELANVTRDCGIICDVYISWPPRERLCAERGAHVYKNRNVNHRTF